MRRPSCHTIARDCSSVGETVLFSSVSESTAARNAASSPLIPQPYTTLLFGASSASTKW
jgi:hypothetical protein